MKLLTWIASSLLLSPSCFAQLTSAPEVSLELGSVRVSLMMPRQDVLKLFTAAGFKTLSGGGEDGRFTFGSRDSRQSFEVQFAKDKLIYASRDWFTSFQKDDVGAFERTLAALTALGESQVGKSSSCTILAQPVSTPTKSLSRVFLDCFPYQLLFIDGKIDGEPVHRVTESIGQVLSLTEIQQVEGRSQ
jgi:hypothetical protein